MFEVGALCRGLLGRAGSGFGLVAGWWRWGLCWGRRVPGVGLDEQGEVAELSQCPGVGVRPGPVCGQAQLVAAGVVDEAAGHGGEPVADCGGDGELVGVLGASESCGPAGDVVGERGASEPGGVCEEPSRGAVAQSGVFEVFDGGFDSGVGSVVGVGGFGVEVAAAGDEAVVAPVGPKLCLGADEAGAAYDEPQFAGFGAAGSGACFDGGLSDLGLAAGGVGDGLPRLVVDAGDGCFDLGVLGDGDRPGRAFASMASIIS